MQCRFHSIYFALVLAVASLAAGSLWGGESSGPAFRSLADEYFEKVLFRYQPSTATYLGLHQYDSQMEDFSRATLDQQRRDLHTFEDRVARISAAELSPLDRADREVLLNSIRSALLTLEVIRPWEKNPDVYSSSLASSAFLLIERKFAPPADRLRSVIARERRMPAVLEQGRQNLKNPPPVYTDIAERQIDGNINFFEKDLPAAFADVQDSQLKSEFQAANKAVIKSLRDYRQWLKSNLMPRSKGDFEIGAETYSKKLAYDEMVDTPLAHLLEIGYADLHKNQASFQRIAKEVDSAKKPADVLNELGDDHPAAVQLLKSFSNTFDGLIQFINAKHIITIPSKVRPTLEETPPFMRATTFASMDTPGPFEKNATEALFNVTLPEKNWDAARVNSFMHTFSYSTIAAIAIHEAYPGHYVQLLYSHNAPSRLRKIIGANSNIEGWAHYCEQMMMDEGYAQAAAPGNPRRARMIQLGQLQEALLRDARYIVGIKMHTGQMTMEQGRQFFVTEGYQSSESARVETDRGTSDPTYLYYTLGKLEILKLRADLQKKKAATSPWKTFTTPLCVRAIPPFASSAVLCSVTILLLSDSAKLAKLVKP